MSPAASRSASRRRPGRNLPEGPYEDRLRGLSRDQLADRLRWLWWWAPGTFTAVMDYMDFVDNVEAATGRSVHAARTARAEPAEVAGA